MSDTGADANNNSVVLRLEWGQMSFLLTGDLEAAGEEMLIKSRQPVAATVLKVGHHGGGGSSTVPFLARVAPSYAVISVGTANRFGHPDPAALERLTQQGGIAILRTDEQGTIEFTTDGQRLWIQSEREWQGTTGTGIRPLWRGSGHPGQHGGLAARCMQSISKTPALGILRGLGIGSSGQMARSTA
jgi:beta-lactamase superfamily II metal-dependent hydrolase